MPTTNRPDVDDLSRRIRELWRHEPGVPESERTTLKIRLQDLRTGLEQLQQRHRAQRLSDEEFNRRAGWFAAEFERLRIAWA